MLVLVRASAFVDDVAGLGAHDHVCWPFHDRDDFLTQAAAFLRDGIELGQRPLYVGRDAAAAADLGDLLDVDVVTTREMYGVGYVADPSVQVEEYAAATEAALAAGFTGLRVAADATDLVRTPEQRDAFIRYEHLVDRRMRSMPFSAMCAYDVGELGPDAVSELACMHPVSRTGAVPFRLHASSEAGQHASIAGEVDGMCDGLFAAALRRLPVASDGPVVLDASRLEFVDHRALLALGRLSSGVVLRDAPRLAARQVALFRLDHVTVEPRS